MVFSEPRAPEEASHALVEESGQEEQQLVQESGTSSTAGPRIDKSGRRAKTCRRTFQLPKKASPEGLKKLQAMQKEAVRTNRASHH